MSRFSRGILGAVLGALLALAAHPYSRPRLLMPLGFWNPPTELITSPELLGGLRVLPQPTSLSDFSMWMESGAKRVLDRYPTSAKDWNNLQAAALQASKKDPQNAFWLQMHAVLSQAAKDRTQAYRSWQRASRKQNWDDGQTARLKRIRERLVGRYGPGAWTSASVYSLRSFAPALCIEGFARDIARMTSLQSVDGLGLRLATVRNGKLMRDGARSMRVAEVGIAVIELASYPSNLTSIYSPRKLLLARTELYGSIREKISQTDADEVDRAYRDNDSWLGYPSALEASQDAEELALLAGIGNGSTSVLLAVSFVGLMGVVLAKGLSTRLGNLLLRPPGAGLAGVGLAAFAYIDTRHVVLAIAVAAGFGFLAFAPTRERKQPSFELGPLHKLLMLILGGIVLAATAFGLATNLAASQALISSSTLPVEAFGGPDPAVSGYLLTLATLAVISAFYGLAQRISPADVFVSTLSRLGAGLAWFGICVAVVSAPALLLLDRYGELTGTQRLENEPVYYYFKG